MKTLISFVGNICSGKTTISKKLSKKHSIKLYSIDEYRIKHNAYLISEEWAAWDELTSDISKNNIAILESSGLSRSATDIYKLFDKVIIILIDCPESELVKRIIKRNNSNYKKVPFCYSSESESIQSRVSKFSIKLKSIHYDYIFNSNEMTVNEIVESLGSVFL